MKKNWLIEKTLSLKSKNSMDKTREVIIGLHSIACAIQNTDRIKDQLYATNKGFKDLLNLLGQEGKKICPKPVKMDSHALQEKAKKLYKEQETDYKRVPGGLLLLASATPLFNADWIYGKVDRADDINIVCLDGVTDVNNIAAIMRTSAFYGVDALIFSSKGDFTVRPAMSRIASGALEYVPLVKVSNMPKTLGQLRKKGVEVIGLSEHATKPL